MLRLCMYVWTCEVAKLYMTILQPAARSLYILHCKTIIWLLVSCLWCIYYWRWVSQCVAPVGGRSKLLRQSRQSNTIFYTRWRALRSALLMLNQTQSQGIFACGVSNSRAKRFVRILHLHLPPLQTESLSFTVNTHYNKIKMPILIHEHCSKRDVCIIRMRRGLSAAVARCPSVCPSHVGGLSIIKLSVLYLQGPIRFFAIFVADCRVNRMKLCI